MPLSLVLFDMDDVLCHYDRSARVKRLARLSNRTSDEVVQAIWGSGLEAKADAGLIDDAQYLQETGRLLGCEVSEEEWRLARREAMSPNLDVLALAKAVSNQCRIAVLTNNPELVAKHIAYLCPEILELFGADIFASASFKAAKPAEETFLRCLDALGASPAQTLFVDDLETNVAGARRAGLFGHVFTSPPRLADELSKHRFSVD